MVSDDNNLTLNERRKIKRALPLSIIRNGSSKPIHYYKNPDGRYQIWYGDIITGNYVAQNEELDVCIWRTREYIDKYLNKDEIYMCDLAIKKNECPYCHKRLVLDETDKSYHVCPECKICYRKFSLWQKIQFRLWKWWINKLIGGRRNGNCSSCR